MAHAPYSEDVAFSVEIVDGLQRLFQWAHDAGEDTVARLAAIQSSKNETLKKSIFDSLDAILTIAKDIGSDDLPAQPGGASDPKPAPPAAMSAKDLQRACESDSSIHKAFP